jgi:hypothetical protein
MNKLLALAVVGCSVAYKYATRREIELTVKNKIIVGNSAFIISNNNHKYTIKRYFVLNDENKWNALHIGQTYCVTINGLRVGSLNCPNIIKIYNTESEDDMQINLQPSC